MNRDDDDRSIDRFVAGLPVDEDALADAITARGIERTIVVEALVGALESTEATARLRAAERVARMEDVAEPVARALTRIAGGDVDLDVRAAAAAALRTHGEPVPGEPMPSHATRRPTEAAVARRASRLSVAFQHMAMRSGESAAPLLLLLPIDRAKAPARGSARLDDAGSWSVTLSGLAGEFAGTRPLLWVPGEDGLPFHLGTAADPVTSGGSVTIVIGPEAGSASDVQRLLSGRVELHAPDD